MCFWLGGWYYDAIYLFFNDCKKYRHIRFACRLGGSNSRTIGCPAIHNVSYSADPFLNFHRSNIAVRSYSFFKNKANYRRQGLISPVFFFFLEQARSLYQNNRWYKHLVLRFPLSFLPFCERCSFFLNRDRQGFSFLSDTPPECLFSFFLPCQSLFLFLVGGIC